MGRSTKGIPQGSPLSPVLFLLKMAPILREMERRIVQEVPGVGVKFSSYVDNLHCGLYAGWWTLMGLDGFRRRERMEDLLDRQLMTQ